MPVEKSFTVLGGDLVEVLVSSTTSNGQYCIFTEIVHPQVGPPPHIHTLEEEFLMPLYGDFEVFDGTAWSSMPREGIHCPRHKLHTFRNPGTEPGKLFVMATGSSFAVFLERLIPLRLPRDMQELIQISAEHGISYVLPQSPEQMAAPV